MHGDSRRDRDIDAARRPELGDRDGQRSAVSGVVADTGAFLAEQQQAVPWQRRLLQPCRTGHDVDGDHRQARFGGEAQQLGGVVVVQQALIAVGDHGAATIPPATADDVHSVHGECVGGAYHPADVGVMPEVLDRHVQRVPAGVDVGDDRLPRPVPIGVDDVAGVAVAQQRRVISRVVG